MPILTTNSAVWWQMRKRKGCDARGKKLLMVGLMANALAACSSPPKLSEPEGDWVSFETPYTAAPSVTTAARSLVRQSVAASSSYIQRAPPPVSSPARPPVLTSLVTADGKNVPLYMAVRTVVPTSENIRLSPDVAQSFRNNVSWTGNDQWPFVLQKMLRANGLEAVIDAGKHEVMIQYGQKAGVPVKPVISAAINVTKATPAPGDKPKGGLLQTPVVPVVTQGAQPAAKKPPVVPVAPVLPVQTTKIWTASKGTTLKATYLVWAAKEKCPAGGKVWEVRWETDTDYPIDYPLTFSSSSFENVTTQLFDLYRRAPAPVYVHGYRNQCLIIINDTK